MGDGLRVAVAQLRSGQEVEENLRVCRELTREAAEAGAQLVAFPENAPYLGTAKERLTLVEPLDGRVVGAFRAMARDHGIAVLLGSMAEEGPDPGRSYNTSVWIEASGEVAGVYRKMHLFDVDAGEGLSFKESASMAAGDELVTVPWRGLTVGMSICYDLRFPELYRALRRRGADVLVVPSAFTERTGRDHWEVLLRARAIEEQCYVIAPNQWGHHCRGRDSYGRSMVIDPWGTVLATAADGVGLALATLDRERLATVRAGMPCLSHARL